MKDTRERMMAELLALFELGHVDNVTGKVDSTTVSSAAKSEEKNQTEERPSRAIEQ